MRKIANRRMDYYIKKLQSSAAYRDILDRCGAIEADERIYCAAFLPILFEYVRWVLMEAIKTGKKRLYFLARDGYQMYLLANGLVDKWQLDIECRYLHVSRYAIRVPEYHLNGKECLNYICAGGIDVTFEKIMKRAGLTDEEAKQTAAQCGWKEKYREILNYNEAIALREVLGKQESFLELVYTHSKSAYDSAVGYLQQEGLMDDISYALVDSGWVGTLQKSIEHLVQTVNPHKTITGYYFGMYEYPSKDAEDKYSTFYFSPKKRLRRKVYFSNCLFEAVFSSPEGMTIAYEENTFNPIFDLTNNPNWERIERYAKLIENFVNSYEGNALDEFLFKGGAKLVEKLVMKLMGTPTEEEARIFGGFLFCDDLLEKSMQKVAAELTDSEIKNMRFWSKLLIMKGIKQGIIRDSAWIEGTIARNGVSVSSNLWHARMYKYIVYIRKRLQQGVF